MIGRSARASSVAAPSATSLSTYADNPELDLDLSSLLSPGCEASTSTSASILDMQDHESGAVSVPTSMPNRSNTNIASPERSFSHQSTGACYISLDDASTLFEVFYTRLNVRWSLLQADVHTPAFCYARSPFLYNTGRSDHCALAAVV